jgi:hypothetical protein
MTRTKWGAAPKMHSPRRSESAGGRSRAPARPSRWGTSPPWAASQQPIDVRDIIHVPQGQLAPRDYVEYLPEWWRERSFYPTIPPRR